MLLLSRTRIFAAGGLILLIAIDVVYHAHIGKFMASSPVGGIVSCAVAAFVAGFQFADLRKQVLDELDKS
jgi:hypothetical protein